MSEALGSTIAAVERLLAKDAGAAMAQAEIATRDWPKDVRLWELLALSAERAGAADKALQAWRSAQKLRPGLIMALIGEAKLLIAKGEAKRAHALLGEFWTVHRRHPVFMEFFISTMENAGNWPTVLVALEECGRDGVTIASADLRFIDACLQMGRTDQALKLIEARLLEDGPTNPSQPAMLKLLDTIADDGSAALRWEQRLTSGGLTLAQSGIALSYLERVYPAKRFFAFLRLLVERQSTHVDILVAVTQLYQRHARTNDAIDLHNRILERDPLNITSGIFFVNRLAGEGQFRQAIHRITELTRRHPEVPEVQTAAVALLLRGSDAKGAADYVVRHAPKAGKIVAQVCDYLLDCYLEDDALTFLDSLPADARKSGDYVAARRRLDQHRTRGAAALKAWRDAAGRQGDLLRLMALVMTFKTQGKVLVAEAGGRDLLVRFSQDPRPYRIMSEAFISGAVDPYRANQVIQQAARQFPDDSEVQLKYLYLLRSLNRLDDAAEHLSRLSSAMTRHAMIRRFQVWLGTVLGADNLVRSAYRSLDEKGSRLDPDDGMLELFRLNADADLDASARREGFQRLRTIFPYYGALADMGKAAATSQTPSAVSRNPRIAVCVSGQLRGYKQAAVNLRKALIDSYDVDVFVHTWDSVGGLSDKAGALDRHLPPIFRQKLTHEERFTETFIAKYPSTRKLFANTPTSREELEDIYQTQYVWIEKETEFDSWLKTIDKSIISTANQCKMFYKIFACSKEKQAHEFQTTKAYDFTVRIRPDLNIGSFSLDEAISRCGAGGTILVNTPPAIEGVGDVFAVGRSEDMDVYASLWSRALSAGTSVYCPGMRGGYGEELLSDHLFVNGLTARRSSDSSIGWLKSTQVDTRALLDALLTDIVQRKPKRSEYEIVQHLTGEVVAELGRRPEAQEADLTAWHQRMAPVFGEPLLARAIVLDSRAKPVEAGVLRARFAKDAAKIPN